MPQQELLPLLTLGDSPSISSIDRFHLPASPQLWTLNLDAYSVKFCCTVHVVPCTHIDNKFIAAAGGLEH